MVLISPVTSQNDDLQRTIEQLHYQGAEDILVSAPQQSAYGYQVGYNHPELQYTLEGQRYYIRILNSYVAITDRIERYESPLHVS